MPEDQDEDTSAHTEVPGYPDAETSTHHEVSYAGARYNGNIYKTPEYVRAIDLDV